MGVDFMILLAQKEIEAVSRHQVNAVIKLANKTFGQGQ